MLGRPGVHVVLRGQRHDPVHAGPPAARLPHLLRRRQPRQHDTGVGRGIMFQKMPRLVSYSSDRLKIMNNTKRKTNIRKELENDRQDFKAGHLQI